MSRVAYSVGTVAFAFLLTSILPAADPQPETDAEAKPRILSGKVTAVIDGDTLSLQDGQEDQAIRMAGIDAPEERQAFGKEAKQTLAKMVLDKAVKVLVLGDDRERRILGVVYVDGKCVNTVMVREGCAWHYARHTQSKALQQAQDKAKREKLGLWAGPSATPPWIWIRTHRHLGTSAPEADPGVVLTPVSPQPQATPSPGYWLNTSSGVRHNPWCRYYRNTNYGRPCGPSEGKTCSVCGS